MTRSCQETKTNQTTLKLDKLSVIYTCEAGRRPAVNEVSLEVPSGSCVALVGESGSGKSTVIKACLGLLPRSASLFGSIIFESQNIASPSASQIRLVRRRMALVSQNSYGAFDPLFTVRTQIIEVAKARNSGISEVYLALKKVNLGSDVLEKFPHELSGGMLQRVQIAMALVGRPALILADEPTASVDPLQRLEVARLLKEVKQKTQAAMLLVTHDLLLSLWLADRIAVMERGRIVESGGPKQLLFRPAHPATQRLVEAARACAISWPEEKDWVD